SFHEMIAGRSSLNRNRFSAKLSFVPSNHFGPSSASGGAMRSSPMHLLESKPSAISPQKSATARQNSSRLRIDHSCNTPYGNGTPLSPAASSPRERSDATKRVRFASRTCSGDGRQIGCTCAVVIPVPEIRRFVIPAKAGIHLLPIDSLLSSHSEIDNMDSRFRGNDEDYMDWRFRGNDEDYMDSRFRGNDEGQRAPQATKLTKSAVRTLSARAAPRSTTCGSSDLRCRAPASRP